MKRKSHILILSFIFLSIFSEKDLYILSIDSSEQFKLFNEDVNAWSFSPKWSPDGEWIYFQRTEYKENYFFPTIWKIKPNGTGLSMLDINFDKPITHIDCSNDGKYLVIEYLSKNDHSIISIMISSIDGKKKRLLDSSNIRSSPFSHQMIDGYALYNLVNYLLHLLI
ncbi:MAG: TolB family protein [bacterium]